MRASHRNTNHSRPAGKPPARRGNPAVAILAAAVLLALGVATPAYATDFVVTDAGDSGPGTLREAVLDANANTGPHTISFALPTGTTIGLTSGDIAFTGPDVTVQGPGQDALIISGSQTSRIFDVQAGSLTVNDMTLRDGLAQGDGTNFHDIVGGAIRVGPLPPPLTPAQFSALVATARPQMKNETSGSTPGRAHRSAGLRALQLLSQSAITGAPAPGLALDHVSLLDNRADAPQLAAGGAVFVSGGAALLMRNSLVSGNSTSFGGGAICAIGADDFNGLTSAGSFDIADSMFTGNHIDQNGGSGQGGVILSYGPGGNIARSVFSNNVINDAPEQDFSEGEGAALAIVVADFPVNIIDSEISGNTIILRAGAYSEGAGLYCQNPYGGATPLTITNSTISGNQSEYGAAIEVRCNLHLFNSTLAANISPNTNGDGDAVDVIDAEGVFNAASTLIYNPAAHVDLFLFEGAKELGTVSNSLIFAPDPSTPPLPPDTIIGVDPLLAPLTNNGGPTRTHALQAGSVAIDAGSNPHALSSDQRGSGFARVTGVAADIGAFESDADRILTNGFE
jgi:hypothetical protein